MSLKSKEVFIMKRIMLFSLMILSIGILAACSANRPTIDDDDYGLAQIKDYEELSRLIEDSQQTYWLFDRLTPSMEADGALDDSANEGSTNTDHSETNVQVEGVDEGDIVKTDGNIIITIADNRLNVIRVLTDGQMEIVMQSTVDLTYAYYTDLYLTEDYIIAIGYHYEYTYFDQDGSEMNDTMIHDDYYYGYGRSATFVEVYNREDYSLQDTFEISGYLMTSRLIDNQLIFISNMSVMLREDVDPRPYIKENGEATLVDYSDIKYIPDTSYDNFVMITSVLLGDDNTIETNVFLGSGWWSNIYINQNEIYLATTYYDWSVFGETRQYGLLISYLFDENGVTFGGAGEYKGNVINQFAMDVYDNHFRLVTTEGWGDDTVNRLYVFRRIENEDGERRLEVVGSIFEGLGKPRESVRSVSFNGEQATVVTFEITDPFYVVDLSDPENPFISGELEITGYSTYQKPWGENTVIGIGYEASDTGAILGLKLSLYDVSNPEMPVEVGESLVLSNSSQWQYSEALYNHKAILVAKSRDFIGFNISRYYYYSNEFKNTDDYMIFSIDENSETPITITTILSHFDLYQTYQDSFDSSEYYYGYYHYNFSVRRAVYVGDYLFLISNEAITSHDMTNEFTLTETLLLRIDVE